MPRYRAPLQPLLVVALGLCLAVAGCASGKPHAGAIPGPESPIPLPADTSSVTALPTDPASPSASPSTSRKPTPRPTPTKSRTPAPSPSTTAPLKPSTAHSGPFDSMRLTGSSAVALTFDDGPDPTYTPKILDLLKQNNVKATFCLIGSRARDYPDLVRRIVAEGHSLCNHSWQHLIDLGQRDPSYQSWDLTSTNNAIHAAVPDAPIKYFRAPGGNFTQALVDLASSLGMRSLYWDVDPRDWDSASFGTGAPMVNHIVTTVKGTIRAGSVILSHDRAHPDTPTAYQTLIPWLKARYQLIPLPTG